MRARCLPPPRARSLPRRPLAPTTLVPLIRGCARSTTPLLDSPAPRLDVTQGRRYRAISRQQRACAVDYCSDHLVVPTVSMARAPDFWAGFRRDAATGVSVGLTDIALVYPLAVIATRRENGMSLRAALAARNLHSGGWTAGTLLVPYSVLVESMSQYLNSMNAESGGPQGAGSNGQLRMFAAAGATSLVASIGVQPIEKKLTMDQMLESEAARRAVAARYPGQPNPLLTPLREIAAYTQAEGVAALFGGFLPLYVVASI